eukprot:Hpha_TRINITY_DN8906_c0_g1::TRINITY_DN8906_c0_g1_i1::g.81077::m.81077
MNGLHEVFAIIDKDGGGTISTEEVLEFTGSFPNPPSKEDVHALVTAADADGSGEIDEGEFTEVVTRVQSVAGLNIEVMVQHYTDWCFEQLFKKLARTGAISRGDLVGLLDKLDTGHSHQEIQRIFDKHDADQSGNIDVEEFVGIMREVGKGMPISQLKNRFEEEQRKAEARMAARKNMFKGAAEESPELIPRSPRSPKSPKKLAIPQQPLSPSQAPSLRPPASQPPASQPPASRRGSGDFPSRRGSGDFASSRRGSAPDMLAVAREKENALRSEVERLMESLLRAEQMLYSAEAREREERILRQKAEQQADTLRKEAGSGGKDTPANRQSIALGQGPSFASPQAAGITSDMGREELQRRLSEAEVDLQKERLAHDRLRKAHQEASTLRNQVSDLRQQLTQAQEMKKEAEKIKLDAIRKKVNAERSSESKTSLLDQAKLCIESLREQVMQRDSEIEDLRAKLTRAQNAIADSCLRIDRPPHAREGSPGRGDKSERRADGRAASGSLPRGDAAKRSATVSSAGVEQMLRDRATKLRSAAVQGSPLPASDVWERQEDPAVAAAANLAAKVLAGRAVSTSPREASSSPLLRSPLPPDMPSPHNSLLVSAPRNRSPERVAGTVTALQERLRVLGSEITRHEHLNWELRDREFRGLADLERAAAEVCSDAGSIARQLRQEQER